MDIQIPRLTRPIALKEYAPELGEAKIFAWVNPTQEFLGRYSALWQRKNEADARVKSLAEGDADGVQQVVNEMGAIGDGFADWYAEAWSQNPDPASHWTADEVRQIASHPTDPGFYTWLTGRTWDAIREHREAAKKK